MIFLKEKINLVEDKINFNLGSHVIQLFNNLKI